MLDLLIEVEEVKVHYSLTRGLDNTNTAIKHFSSVKKVNNDETDAITTVSTHTTMKLSSQQQQDEERSFLFLGVRNKVSN